MKINTLAGVALCLLSATMPLQGASIAGVDYQGVNATARQLGMSASVDEQNGTIVWKSNKDKVELELNKRTCKINGTKVVMNFPLAKSGPYYYVSKTDAQKVFAPLIDPRSYAQGLQLRHIVLDPGHGGKDSGARNDQMGTNEKTLVLDIARRLASDLRQKGYRVTLTRNDDHFIPLPERPELANKLGADLFISLHLNATSNKSVTGVETYIYPPKGSPSSSRSKVLASDNIWRSANRYDAENLWAGFLIQKSLVKTLPSADRGLKHARLKVLETPNCPALLIEGGFISSSSECSRLKSGLYRQQIADAITSGIQAYHRILLATR